MVLIALAAAALGGGCGDAVLAAGDVINVLGLPEAVSQMGGFRVSAGATTAWDVPAGTCKPGRYSGLVLDLVDDWGLGLGLDYFDGPDGERLVTGSLYWDVGLAIAHRRQEKSKRDRQPRWWPVVEPEIGWWGLPTFPENDGLMTGVAVGFAIRRGPAMPGESEFVRIEFRWQWLNDADGDQDAAVGKVLLSYTWHW